MYQSQEAMQDSMLGLKEAMFAILGKNGKRIEDIDGFENAYLGENGLSSVNKAEADAFAHTLFKPMLDEVAKLSHNEAEREGLTDYIMAKHGLERNRVMAERDAQKDYDENMKLLFFICLVFAAFVMLASFLHFSFLFYIVVFQLFVFFSCFFSCFMAYFFLFIFGLYA